MAHKTLMGGTAYNISGGKSMVSGTSYNITGGRTLVGGTGYNISFGGGKPVAMLYSDGSFVFQKGNEITDGKTLINQYEGWENSTYASNSVPWYNEINNIKNVTFEEQVSPFSLSNWFRNAYNLTNLNASGLNTNRITSMRNAFSWCNMLSSPPICGDNVTDMHSAYFNCRKLIGPPVCGNNVKSMYYTYYGCYNLTGSPVCGNNVTSMGLAYHSCYNITGSPVCGNNVTNMEYAYAYCSKLTGPPVCGDNVKDMSGAYYNACNITGSPVCGNNVTSMSSTYYNCRKIAGNAYFYSSMVTNVESCFVLKNIAKRLNIYVPSNSKTNNTVHLSNTTSLMGREITWTNAGTYQYNTYYNIYIYPVENVAAARAANGD